MVNPFDTERGPASSTHLFVIVALVIIAAGVALMIPHLRIELFGAAVALYNAVH